MKLSIITINRNNAEGLRKTIESVLAQTYRDFEYIIVDGASTDNSVDVIQEYESVNKTSQVSIPFKWLSEQDSGIYNAMNKGTLMAEGEYCLYLNSGDSLYEEETLQKSFELNKNYDVFWGKILFCSSDDFIDVRYVDNIDLTPFQQYSLTIPHQACFIKRSVLIEENLYDEKYKIASDHKFLYKTVILDKRPSAYIDVIVSVMEGNGISTNKDLCMQDEAILFCEFFPSWLWADYCDWYNMRERIIVQERYINLYHNSIVVYNYIKNKPLLRKAYTAFYKYIMHRMLQKGDIELK